MISSYFSKLKSVKSMYGIIFDTVKNFPTATLINVFVIILATFVEAIGFVLLLPFLEIILNNDLNEISGFSKYILKVFNYIGLDFEVRTFLLLFGSLLILKHIFLSFSTWQITRVWSELISLSRKKFLNNLISTKFNFFNSLSLGALVNSINREAESPANAYSITCHIIVSFLQCLMLITLSFFVSWEITFAAITISFLIIFILKRFIDATKKLGKKDTVVRSVFNKKFVEIMSSLKHLKVSGEENRIKKILFTNIENINKNTKKFVFFQENIICFQNIFFTTSLLFGIYYLLVNISFPIERIAVLSALFLRLTQGMGRIQKFSHKLAQCEAPYKKITNLNKVLKINYDKKEVEVKNISNSIELKNIFFSYDKKEIIKNISLKLRIGQITLLKGSSGIGKTTLVDIICGLLNPTKGEILIDNRIVKPEITKLKKDLVGYIPQDYFLYNDTILNNLTLGNSKKLNKNLINDSLRVAEADKFVFNLKNGLNTKLGEKGTKISGGQRQRIALAITLLKQPRILILDEATSALDINTENKILNNIKKCKKKFAVIIISHRNNVTKFADKIINLNK